MRARPLLSCRVGRWGQHRARIGYSEDISPEQVARGVGEKGVLMSESESQRVELECPECGTVFPFEAWTAIYADERPDEAVRVQDGSLFTAVCPVCGAASAIEQPCLYVDPEHGACAYLVCDDEMFQEAVGMLEELAAEEGPGLRRVTSSADELAEKARIFAAGLDDRPLALMKVMLAGSLMAEGRLVPGLPYDMVFESEDGSDLAIHFTQDQNEFTALAPCEGYEFFAAEFARSALAAESPVRLNGEWAEHALEVLDREGLLE